MLVVVYRLVGLERWFALCSGGGCGGEQEAIAVHDVVGRATVHYGEVGLRASYGDDFKDGVLVGIGLKIRLYDARTVRTPIVGLGLVGILDGVLAIKTLDVVGVPSWVVGVDALACPE